MNFVNGEEDILETAGWRDDMKFLFHLTRVFRFYNETGRFPKVEFKKIPNLSNARWNTRAILALLAFILLPQEIHVLQEVCSFISYNWAEHWFTDQHYQEHDYENLCRSLEAYQKALTCVKNFWSTEKSKLDIPQSNQCAERAIKCLQNLKNTCKKKDAIHLRFILSNKS